MNNEDYSCPVCQSVCEILDVVDFNKSCEEVRGKYLKKSGIPVYYYLCISCGYSFCPEICSWSLLEFSDKIYNDSYIEVDPDYADSRPKANADAIKKMFYSSFDNISHIDYGGGSGLMSLTLKEFGLNSVSYDPFVDVNVSFSELGQYDLITALEVFEHTPSPGKLMEQLTALMKDDSLILFSTIISDGKISLNKRLDWWYASPRNGHISIFSKKSLSILAGRWQLNFGSFSDGLHLFFKNIPEWAENVIKRN